MYLQSKTFIYIISVFTLFFLQVARPLRVAFAMKEQCDPSLSFLSSVILHCEEGLDIGLKLEILRYFRFSLILGQQRVI